MKPRKKSICNLSELVDKREPLVGFSARLEQSYLDKMNAIAERERLSKSDFIRAAIQFFWNSANPSAHINRRRD